MGILTTGENLNWGLGKFGINMGLEKLLNCRIYSCWGTWEIEVNYGIRGKKLGILGKIGKVGKMEYLGKLRD